MAPKPSRRNKNKQGDQPVADTNEPLPDRSVTFLSTTGKIDRYDLNVPSHRQTPILKEQGYQSVVSKVSDVDFDPYDMTGFLATQNRATLSQQRENHLNHIKDAELRKQEELQHYPLRQQIVTQGNSLTVLTNHFKVALPRGKTLQEYHVQGMPAKTSRAKARMLILDMLEIDPQLFKQRDKIATDYKKKIISCAPLFGNENAAHSVNVNYFEVGSRDEPKQITLNIHPVARHGLDRLREFVEGTDLLYKDTGAKEALNIILSKAVADAGQNKDTFQVGDNRFYFRPSWNDLKAEGIDGSGLVSIRGYFSSIRPAMGNVLLNVNNVTGAFYKAQKLYAYIKDHKDSEISDGDKKALKCHLCGLRVAVDFSRAKPKGQEALDDPERQRKTLVDLGNAPDFQEFKPISASLYITVWKHLTEKYVRDNVSDVDRDLLTANVGQKKGDNKKFYLAHQLCVLPDQLFRGTLSPEVTKAMIDVAKKKPKENYHAILAEARQIPAPNLVYKNAQGNDSPMIPQWPGSWNVPKGSSFVKTNPIGKVRFFLAEARSYNSNGKFVQAYIDRFIAHHNGYGGLTFQKSPEKKYVQLQDWSVEALMGELSKDANSCDIAIVVFLSNNKEQRQRYANFKIVADQLLGVKSVCLCEEKMLKIAGRGPDRSSGGETKLTERQSLEWSEKLTDYFSNVSMKLNTRNGGINHILGPTSLSSIAPVGGQCDTMIIGADVTHPSPGGARGIPSIAAVVGSMDKNFARYSGQVRLNPSGIDIIEDMQAMFRKLLHTWFTENGKRLPSRILLYRDGVGDSQYGNVRGQEVKAIRDAWQDYKARCKTPIPQARPLITAIIGSKRHNTRLYPKSDENKSTTTTSGNCIPGTLVDAGIVSPYYLDFFLLSHNVPGKSGTARPTHYFVVENEMNLTAHELQDLTFNLCFTYCKSTTSVSYVPATYYADKLCERGRLYLQPFVDRAGDVSDETFLEEARKDFYRGGGRESGSIGRPVNNPWHKNHDDSMFWM